MLAGVPSFFTLCTGVVIFYAVIHDWIYFQVVGTAFYKTFTLADHVTSALERVPLAGFGFFVALVFSLFRSSRRIEGNAEMPANALVIYESDTFKLWTVPDKLRNFVYSGLILIIPSILFLPKNNFIFYILFCYWLWEALARRPLNHLAKLGLAKLRPILFYIPILFIYSFMTGLAYGLADISASPGNYRVTLMDNSVMDRVRVLRSTASNVLVRIPQQSTNKMIPWRQIKEIEIPRFRSDKSIACRAWDLCLLE